ncbi:MAG: hypothetical protein KY440_06030 [Actinobacteria bacterium]|nr:hypothetical protein [Actinomycetota bacterium]
MKLSRATGTRSTRLVAFAVVLQLSMGLLSVAVVDQPDVQRQPAATPSTAPEPRAAGAQRAAPSAAELERAADTERKGQVERLLAARSAAILGRDRTAFLATVDPRAAALQARQAAMFDALAAVPIGTWEYRFNQRSGRAADAALDLRYGRGLWWAPPVTLSYGLAGFDDIPTIDKHHLTFVRRDGRWLLGADDDFDAVGGRTPRALWERGPVAAVRAPGVLALGHEDTSVLRNVASLTSAAIPRVNEVWGEQWGKRVVVIVPSSAQEMASLIDSTQDFSQIAAVATAEVSDASGEDAIERILVNPDTFTKLGQLGRRVVLTHEVTHVAARRVTGPAVPAWLAEGLADYVGYKDVKVPLSVAARNLRKDVRAGRLPTALPTDEAFNGGNPALAQAYEQSWLAVRLLVERYGEAELLAFYRAVGASEGSDSSVVLSTELRDAFGIDDVRLIADWRAALQRQLG